MLPSWISSSQAGGFRRTPARVPFPACTAPGPFRVPALRVCKRPCHLLAARIRTPPLEDICQLCPFLSPSQFEILTLSELSSVVNREKIREVHRSGRAWVSKTLELTGLFHKQSPIGGVISGNLQGNSVHANCKTRTKHEAGSN